jgi:23S rRNA (cytidine1920-2'-O)/16S rRNA (cytidine1409-2'-O)-methyltransferase
MKKRLDQELVERKLVSSRSQGENYIKLGYVRVSGEVVKKPGVQVRPEAVIELDMESQYVSRAGLKLASVADRFDLDFNDKTVLDVGSSTGGFTDFALQNGARRVIAVDVGTKQMHPKLATDGRVELHEQTDIRVIKLSEKPDIVLIDVSFIRLRDVLPSVSKLSGKQTLIIAMLKPQFEADQETQKHKGIIKNSRIRRDIIKSFEVWLSPSFIILDKADSGVSGAKGNQERFYKLKKK